MSIKMWHREEGLTLIELLVVIAILGIALAGVYTLLIWGYNTFYSGTDKTVLHRQLNLASELLTDETRYATSLELLDEDGWNENELPSGPEEIGAGIHYLYYDQENRALVLFNENGNRQVGGPLISAAIFYIEDGLFHYELEASRGDSTYALQSSVLLLNTAAFSPDEPLPALKYTKP